ncbi:MAG: TIGR00341 family protein [Candidatus Nitrosotenuis sp.]|uniref:TIGR00341 family protein n=1 Tax=Candidatus Nitrosotenuis uzonensis TaxID=1407055 RepID=A0A812EWV3_9ARCH|nr:TIGR00341 family protein [Candidatus Nitrosotenuis uzonensis]MCA2003367.1 TIGR00341 family protein [Candidatus Nitrosotenuis sp.]CAE6495300.1 conserved membrane hypothetical protein [Candidatus Nitrosotenuis uzonensis]
MRKIELTCHEQQSQSIEFVLKKYRVPYNVELVMSGESKLLRYTTIVPEGISNTVTADLNKIIDTKQMEIYLTIQNIEATVSDYLQNVQTEKKEMKKTKKLTEEFHALTEPSVEIKPAVLIMITIASAVALVGLYTNSASLVIGAMLLSPLLGPITAFAFNASVGRPQKMFKSALNIFVLTTIVGATGAALTGLSLTFMEVPITPEILSRTEMSPVFLAVAILLGLAGGIAMSSDIPGILVGVAIAAALVPPAVVTGIGVALFDYNIFINALTLTIANLFGLILGTMTIFYIMGVTPRRYYERQKARQYITYTISVFVVLSIILGTLTFWL